MRVFKIPVEYAVFSTIKIEAETAKDAVKKFHDTIDKISLPTDTDYIDDSFKIACDESEEVEYINFFNGVS